MNVYEHASRIWPVLALAARNRQVLTYEIIEQLIGIPRFGLAGKLDPIQAYCLANGLPALTVLVVGKDSGVPDSGFFAAENIPAEQARVFAHNWSDHSPTVAELQEAATAHPTPAGR
jgi:hypothetical protein